MSNLKIEELADRLCKNKSSIHARQDVIFAKLTPKEQKRSSRNGNPKGGWVVGGVARYTRAIKQAGLPWGFFWSGSNPTPSTQYPLAIWEFLQEQEGVTEQ